MWQRRADDVAAERGHDRAGRPAARRRDPRGHGRHRARRRGRRARSRSVSTSPTTSPRRLPLFFGAVLGLSFLLLMVVFRSLLVPLKAVVMNLLSIGAAYGDRRRRLPVGLGQRPARHRAARPDRAVRADDAVRHRVRPVHGLRGVPALPRPGGVRPHGRQPRRRSPTAWPPPPASSPPPPPIMVARLRQLRRSRPTGSSSCSASGSPSRSSSTPRSSASSSCRPRWSCSADRNWWLPRWLDRVLPTPAHRGAPRPRRRAGRARARGARTGGRMTEHHDLERHRTALTRYCHRMLGSGSDADDAVQETMLRALARPAPVRGPLDAGHLDVPHRDERVPRPHAEPAAASADGRRRAGVGGRFAAGGDGARRQRSGERHRPTGVRPARSSPPWSISPRASARSCSCATCCHGRRARSPSCSIPASCR